MPENLRGLLFSDSPCTHVMALWKSFLTTSVKDCLVFITVTVVMQIIALYYCPVPDVYSSHIAIAA